MQTDAGKASANVIHQAPGGRLRDDNDWNQLRWGRDRHNGFPVGRFLQAPPFFFTADGNPLHLVDSYRGRSCFIIASGPSFADDERFPKHLLRQPGVVTFGLNNSPRIFRPDLWACVDTPSNFMRSIWLDPKIQKFAPLCHTQKKLLDNDSAKRNGTLFTDDERWDWMPDRVMDCPNVTYFRRNEHFKADQFLWEDTINWGSHKDFGGGRSILLAVTRICYLLGFRRVFLLGVDFEMTKDQHYSFAQHRHDSSVRGNMSTYTMLMDRFTKLKPYFDQEGFQVFNCNERSRLNVFPHLPFTDAVAAVQREEMHAIAYDQENTEGLYDREYRLEQRQKKGQKEKPEQPAVTSTRVYSPEERQEVKERLDSARGRLDNAKEELASLQQLKPAEDAQDFAQWQADLREAEARVEDARQAFRTIEDEKRWKHGETIKWNLWKP